MLFSKPCLFVLFSAFLLTANADTIRGVQQRELQATAEVDLGTAGNYAILAESGISTVPSSAITGDIAVSPIDGAAMTGFDLIFADDRKSSTSTQVTGSAYAADYIAPTPTHLTTAVGDMGIAYTDAAGRTNPDAARINVGAGEIGSLTLKQTAGNGVYTFQSDVTISADLTFEGSQDDIFIIQITGNLILSANMAIKLKGVQAKNIFWQVAGHVRVQADAHMKGILLVKTDVLFITGSSLDGRVLAQTACDLQKATIIQPTKLVVAN